MSCVRFNWILSQSCSAVKRISLFPQKPWDLKIIKIWKDLPEEVCHRYHPGDSICIKVFRKTDRLSLSWEGPIQLLLFTHKTTEVKWQTRSSVHASRVKPVPQDKWTGVSSKDLKLHHSKWLALTSPEKKYSRKCIIILIGRLVVLPTAMVILITLNITFSRKQYWLLHYSLFLNCSNVSHSHVFLISSKWGSQFGYGPDLSPIVWLLAKYQGDHLFYNNKVKVINMHPGTQALNLTHTHKY